MAVRAVSNGMRRCPVCRAVRVSSSYTFARHLLWRHPGDFWSIMRDLPEYPDLVRQVRFFGALALVMAAAGIAFIVKALREMG